MQYDNDAIARLERKAQAAREDFRLWIVTFAMVLPALTFAFDIAPEMSLVVVISVGFALFLVVARRAWIDLRVVKSIKDQRAQKFTQSIPKLNDES